MATPMRSTAAAVAVLTAVALAAAPADAAVSAFFNGFETESNTCDRDGTLSGWDIDAFGAPEDGPFMTRVPSGTNEITSRTGSFHAESKQSKLDCDGKFPLGATPPFIQCGGETAATNWGGYSGVPCCSSTSCAAGAFPEGGYTTSLDIYLDVNNKDYQEDTRFDYTSSISAPSGEFRRQFVFNAGFYRDDGSAEGGTLGAGPRFIISASHNAGRSASRPTNPDGDPFVITSSGWYTFQHRFYDNGSGVLAVQLSVLDATGVPLHHWILSDPADVIGSTVGGNRYGWLASQEFPFLAIDNSSRRQFEPISFDFSGAQYASNFRDVRRGSDINSGTDWGNGGRPSLNFTGAAGAAGDTWLTVYDSAPGDADQTILTGGVHMSMDLLYGPFNNRKGLGLLALYNESGDANTRRGLALIVLENGNTDSLALVTVEHDARNIPLSTTKLTPVVASLPLGSKVQLVTWYRLTVDVAVDGDRVTITGQLFKHRDPRDPDSDIDPLGLARMTASTTLGSLRLRGSGEIGIVGVATLAVVNSSVKNFTARQ